jgi:hypothetical protein
MLFFIVRFSPNLDVSIVQGAGVGLGFELVHLKKIDNVTRFNMFHVLFISMVSASGTYTLFSICFTKGNVTIIRTS